MLIIRRRPGESVLIGDGVEVRVVEVAAGRAILGISAPENVLILRKEIRLAERQNLCAARNLNSASVSALVARFRRL